MPIKESSVTYFDKREGWRDSYEIRVFYTDELIKTSLKDLSFSVLHHRYLPYLVVGYFFNKNGLNKWFFSNAQRHEQIEDVVKSEIGTDYTPVFAQFVLHPNENNRPEFTNLRLFSLPSDNDKENTKALRSLFKLINPDYLRDSVLIHTVNDKDMINWGYEYFKETQILENITERRKALGK